jgi:hypothetical protein
MTINTGKLRELAERATAGPWVVWSSLYEHMDAQLRSADTTVEGVALAEFYRLANGYANATYIAAANPQTMIALLDELEDLRLKVVSQGAEHSPSDRLEAQCDLESLDPTIWGVDVRIGGVNVLTIEDSCLSGIPNIAQYRRVVWNCAEHLRSFIGDPDREPDPCFACGGDGCDVCHASERLSESEDGQ